MSDNNVVAIGIDVGGTKILAGAVQANGALQGEARVASPATPEELLPSLSAVTSELLDVLGGGATVVAIGLALPGLVDRQGVLHAAPNLGASERGLDLRTAFGPSLLAEVSERQAGTAPVLALDNDANCAAYAEFSCGAAAQVPDVVVVSLGTGIGGGVISDGRLLRGGRSFAGEVGHMVVERDGEPCPCGRRGCWERYACGSGLAVLARRAIEAGGDATRLLELAKGRDHVAGEHVSAAREGDPVALGIFAEFANWLGLGLANLVELLDPTTLVIGGGLVKESDLFFQLAQRAYETSCRPAQHRHGSDLVLAQLGEHAACIGAGLLAFDQLH